MKTLPLRPFGLAALCGFVSTTLLARDFPSFPDAPPAYGDAVSLQRARDLQFPENATVFQSAVREMTLSSGYFSSFRDPNRRAAKRSVEPDVAFDFSTGKWINSKNGEQVRETLVPWGDRYLSVDPDGHGTMLYKHKAKDGFGSEYFVLAGASVKEELPGEAGPAADTWLEPPRISTPKTDAVKESQGESRTPAGNLGESEPKTRVLVYPADDRDFRPVAGVPRPADPGVGSSGMNLLSDEEIRIGLQPEASTTIWESRPNAGRATVLRSFIRPASEAGSAAPGFSSIDAIAPIITRAREEDSEFFDLEGSNRIWSRHRVVDPDWVTVGTEEPTTRRHPDWLHAPKITTPKTDKVRQSLGEGLEPGFEPSVTLNPIPTKLETISILGAAAETAAGFPGEVIDEVIVPVPSEIFLVLDKLGKPDWKGQLRSGKQPSLTNRIDVALLLGNVVAEGFVAVQAEDRSAVEQIGKDVLRLSESLGLKETVLPHTNSILEASKHSHWEIVRVELDKTQKTVRDTMEQHRDSELAQCVSLGGWLRGTEAVTDLINKNYTSDSAELLNQPDIIRHFQKELKKLAAKNQKLKNMLAGLEAIAVVIGTGDEPPNAGGVQSIHTTTARLVKSIATPSK